MTLLTNAQDAQVAQEVVTAVLQGALSRHGSQKQFATSAGISPVHVNYIIKQKRMPSRKMAEWMAQFLPLPLEERKAWSDYVQAYWEARSTVKRKALQVIQDDFVGIAKEIQRACCIAMDTSDPDVARVYNLIVLDLASQVLQHASPEQHPLLYLQLIKTVFEMNAALGRRTDALWVAQRMQWIVSEVEPLVRREDLMQLHMHRLDSMRVEALILCNIGLRAKACAKIRKVEADPLFKEHFVDWHPLLKRDWLDAVALMAHSDLREARHALRDSLNFLEMHASDRMERDHLLLMRSFAEVAMSHGRFDEARQLLEPFQARRDNIPFFGLGCQVLFDCTYAKMLWKDAKRDLVHWQAVVKRLYATALRAGYSHVVWEMQQYYGDALQKALVSSQG